MSALSDQLQRMYNAYFGRPADPSGIAFWERGVTNSGDFIGAAIKLFGSPATPEFAALYPAGTSIEQFIQTAYANMFNRPTDATGEKFWADAFRAWVASGWDEGVARATIVTEIEKAAWGQVGTNDKLSLVNKQTVANAMTASVKQYGTEFSYLTGLSSARDLLDAVDHTAVSVGAALTRIKYGYVDGKDPATGTPATPVTIVTASQHRDEVELDASKKELLKLTMVDDAPFSYRVLEDGSTMAGGYVILGLQVGRDRIDLSDLNLSAEGISGNISVRTQPWIGADWANWWATNPDGTPAAYKTYEGFFGGKAFAGWETEPGGIAFRSDLFIDVNGNGDLDPETDMWLKVIGVSLESLAQSVAM